jgi:hypothetical protein
MACKRSGVRAPVAPPYPKSPVMWHNSFVRGIASMLAEDCRYREVATLQNFCCGITIPRLCRLAMITAVVLVSVATALASSPTDSKEFHGSSTSESTVQILVAPADLPGTYNFALTYPHTVSAADVQQDLGELARLAGWSITGVSILNNAESRPELLSTTNVEFAVANPIDGRVGSLPVEPMVVTLKRFKSIVLIFALRPDFDFRGLRDYEDKYVRIAHSGGSSAHTYRIDVKRADFGKLNLPTVILPVSAQATPPPSTRSSMGIIWPILISILIGAGVWFISRRAYAKHSERENQ